MRKYWDAPPKEFQTKGGTCFDLVSEADEKTDAAVQQVIRSSFPNDRIVSEELNPEITGDMKQGRVWIIDPLDGTSAFLFKADPSAPSVMIALIVDGVAQISVILQPIIARWTYCVRGRGVFQDGISMKFPDHAAAPFSHAWVDLNQYGDSTFESQTFKKIDSVVRGAGGARLVSRMTPFSAVALRLLLPDNERENASRQLCAAVHDHNREMPKQLPWDIIPVQLIVEEAGGLYLDTATGKRVDAFDLKGPILIGSRAMCAEILKRVNV